MLSVPPLVRRRANEPARHQSVALGCLDTTEDHDRVDEHETNLVRRHVEPLEPVRVRGFAVDCGIGISILLAGTPPGLSAGERYGRCCGEAWPVNEAPRQPKPPTGSSIGTRYTCANSTSSSRLERDSDGR